MYALWNYTMPKITGKQKNIEKTFGSFPAILKFQEKFA